MGDGVGRQHAIQRGGQWYFFGVERRDMRQDVVARFLHSQHGSIFLRVVTIGGNCCTAIL